MPLLLAVTILWAFSFSLIGEFLAGHVDSYFAVLTRVVLAGVIFLPWLLRFPIAPRFALQLMAIGAVQLGLMYVFYYQSFLLLSVPEVLIFTIFTPLYVTLLHDALEGHFHPHYLLSALLAIAGAAIMRWNSISDHFWLGFFVVQGANLCFASGQVFYKRWIAHWPHSQPPAQHRIFGWFYVGALMVVLPLWWLFGKPLYPSTSVQWGVLVWLGVVASGIGYFAWNLGATRVSSGQLAIMNNALIPAGLLVNLLLWNRDTDVLRLLLGGGLIVVALLWTSRTRPQYQP
ncbi:MAG: DMT family transporter [Bacterioplanes sp.]|nr:DMT family transporter [Bacterioplanes sp.]